MHLTGAALRVRKAHCSRPRADLPNLPNVKTLPSARLLVKLICLRIAALLYKVAIMLLQPCWWAPLLLGTHVGVDCLQYQ